MIPTLEGLPLTEQAIADLLPFFNEQELAELDALMLPTRATADRIDFSQYANHPQQFGIDLFGEFYTDDQIAIMHSVRDNPITIAESANAVGKTFCAARIAVWWYKTRKDLSPDGYAQVYTAAAPPERNLRQLLWGEIGAIPQNHPNIFSTDRVLTLHIADQEDVRSYITGVTIPATGTPAQREASFSGKHAPYLLFILDEGDAIPPDVYRGIESCLSGGMGRLLVMYNPRSDEGPIAQMKARGVKPIKLSAFNHPNVITGRDVIPGAVTRNKTLHRIHKWTVPATADYEQVVGYGRFTVPEFLVGAEGTDEETGNPLPPLSSGERIVTDPQFSYMVLGVYPGQTAGVIYDTWVDDYDEAKENGRQPTGNVCEEADFEIGAGNVYWAIDDGYVGEIDPATGQFTTDSHPRVIGMFQMKNGVLCLFNEIARIRQPRPEIQIGEAQTAAVPFSAGRVNEGNVDMLFPLGTVILLDHPAIGPGKLERTAVSTMTLEHGGNRQDIPVTEFPGFCRRIVAEGITAVVNLPRPEFVALGPGSATIGGLLHELGYFTRTCTAGVEESIKQMRLWISQDENGRRRLLVHPRCALARYEARRYKRDPSGRIIKAYDHSMDMIRYLCDRLKYGE